MERSCLVIHVGEMASNGYQHHQHGHHCGHSHEHRSSEFGNEEEGLDDNFLDEMHPCCQKDAASKARSVLNCSDLKTDRLI